MAKGKGQTIQWPKVKGQTDNTMAKSKGQTDNTMTKSKGTDRQYNGQR